MTAKKFLEQREFATENDIRYVCNISRCLDKSVERLKRQTSLTELLANKLHNITQHHFSKSRANGKPLPIKILDYQENESIDGITSYEIGFKHCQILREFEREFNNKRA